MLWKIIAGLEIDIDGPEALGGLKRQKKARAGNRDAFLLRRTRCVGFHLRKYRELPAALALVKEAPLDSGERIAPTALVRLAIGRLHHIGNFIRELHSIAETVIKIDLRHLISCKVAADRLGPGNVDFPIRVAGGARIIGQERRTCLGTDGDRLTKKCQEKVR